jgi:hypothetical protein
VSAVADALARVVCPVTVNAVRRPLAAKKLVVVLFVVEALVDTNVVVVAFVVTILVNVPVVLLSTVIVDEGDVRSVIVALAIVDVARVTTPVAVRVPVVTEVKVGVDTTLIVEVPVREIFDPAVK